MTNKFNKGDLVVLKSGGPPMTVAAAAGEKHFRKADSDYWCEWFKGASKEAASFSEHVLQTYEPPKK